MHIDHLAIWVHDLEQMKTFFLTYFECTANSKYENKQKQFTSYFITMNNGGRIELMHQPHITASIAAFQLGLTHWAIKLESKDAVDQLTNRLRNDGYTIASEPRTTGDGYYESVILDPEKNRIELVA